MSSLEEPKTNVNLASVNESFGVDFSWMFWFLFKVGTLGYIESTLTLDG